EDGKYLVRVHEAAVFGNGADSVRVPIRGQPCVASFLHYCFLQQAHMRLNRLRIYSREQRIYILADRGVANPVIIKDFRKHAAPPAAFVFFTASDSAGVGV